MKERVSRSIRVTMLNTSIPTTLTTHPSATPWAPLLLKTLQVQTTTQSFRGILLLQTRLERAPPEVTPAFLRRIDTPKTRETPSFTDRDREMHQNRPYWLLQAHFCLSRHSQLNSQRQRPLPLLTTPLHTLPL